MTALSQKTPESRVRVGLSLPPTGFASHDVAAAYVNSAADAGLDHLVTADHVAFFDGRGMDGLVTVSWLAGLHPTIGLYIGVYLLALRHPVAVARQIATLATHAPGRLTFGVGIGGEDRHEMEVMGVNPATRGRQTDEALDLLRPLLAGQIVNHHGEFYDAPNAIIRPSPVPPVTVTVGGRSDAAIRRSGERGDGWLASWCSPRRFAEGVGIAEAAATATGREDVAWRHGYQIWVGLGDTPADGTALLGPAMEKFYRTSYSAFERYSPVGTPADIVEWLRPYVEAGAIDLNLAPVAATNAEQVAGAAEIRRLLIA
ncbi:MAG: LLM class flavin-dependent oxidoreductase [Acidimicrobiales bacterium]|nr:LLM class flavin-dependent oxidoreductase [Acidimicrobiales bacterium]